MNILSNEKINFNSLEEKTFKEVMKLGREIIQEELRMLDNLIKKYRDKATFKVKDMRPTTIKSRLGEIPISRRRYEMIVNGKKKCIYLLDEVLQINEFGLYSQGLIEMITREITKKSYRETAKTIAEDTDSPISHTAVRNVVIKLGKKIKEIEEEKIKLYEEGKIEGTKEIEYVFCEHDGIYVKKQKSKKHKGKKKFKQKHFKKKKTKKRKNGIELKIAVIHEGRKPRYKNDYKLKNKIIVGTAQRASELKRIEDAIIGTTYKEYGIKNIIINGDGADWTGSIVEGAKEIFQLDMAHVQKKIYMAISDEEYLKKMQEIVYTEGAKEIFSLIYNYKVELEADNKTDELEKVKELEEYLRNNEEGLQRYQYKLGYKAEQIEEHKEDLPSLGSEESHMYCVCRDRMKKNRTSWSQERSRSNVKGNNEQDEWNNKRSYYKESRRKDKRRISTKDTRPKESKENKYSSNTICGKI